MSDQKVGAAFRAVRIRRGWRQKDAANEADVSASLVSAIERGHIGTVTIDVLRGVGTVLDIRIDVLARWRGGELDRLLSARHSALQDLVATWIGAIPGWTVVPEVSFNFYGERGSVDLLAWHGRTRTLLVIEIKTQIVDVPELLGTMDRKVRLAPRIGRERGWAPAVVASWLVVAEGSTNRHRVTAFSSLIRSAFPAGTVDMRRWIRRPSGTIAGLSFFPNYSPGGVRKEVGGAQRVRAPGPGPAKRGTSRDGA
jgi:transcriptional regulator with XRE-family HTH domain